MEEGTAPKPIYMLCRLYWQYKKGLCTVDEWLLQSELVLKESLQDKVQIALAEIWGS